MARDVKSKTPDKDLSARNAKAAFRNFTLKTSATDKGSRHYVESKKDVTKQQAEALSVQIRTLSPAGPGMRIVSSEANPIGMQEDGTLDLATLIEALEKSRSGAQFYTNSQTIATSMDTQTKIDFFFANLKGQQNGNSS